MATQECPSCGAASAKPDYCDNCGAALDRPSRVTSTSSGGTAGPEALAVAQTAVLQSPPAVAPGAACPECGTLRRPDNLFCEVDGVDFLTGHVPASAPRVGAPNTGAGSGWSARIEADRAVFDRNQAECTQAFSFPETPRRREVPLTGTEVVVGRRHETEGFFPDIDISDPVPDPGVSRRHAVLRRQPDESWALLDTASKNGTWLNDDPEPQKPGVPVTLRHGDRIQIGLFTLITMVHDAEATD